MIGITAYGVNVPYYRLKREAIFKAMGWFNPAIARLAKGEKAVANHDEDSLTMAVAAGMEEKRWIHCILPQPRFLTKSGETRPLPARP
jgi:hypothetical protein